MATLRRIHHAGLSPLARALIEAQARLHLTVIQLADQIDIDPGTLRALEGGETRRPREETRSRILAWARTRGFAEFGGLATGLQAIRERLEHSRFDQLRALSPTAAAEMDRQTGRQAERETAGAAQGDIFTE